MCASDGAHIIFFAEGMAVKHDIGNATTRRRPDY